MTIQKLTQARNMLKKIHCDTENPSSFYPVIVSDHPDYTVLISPRLDDYDAPPIQQVVSNSVLVKILSHVEKIADGDERYDDIVFSFDFDFDDDITDYFGSFWFDYTSVSNGVIVIDAKLKALEN